ncbi:MAG: diaminopimelate epimerase [Acidimicrobiales bacterium]
MLSRTLLLSKHHGLGNDFLVLLDPDGSAPVSAEQAAALCDRRRGVGADGLIRAVPGGPAAQVTMELRNSDGSEAEMSGNGIRCLAQAVVDADWVAGSFVIATAGGPRRVAVRPGERPGLVWVEVSMGRVDVEPGERMVDGCDGRSWAGRAVTVGNPHLVLLERDPDVLAGLDLALLGPPIETSVPAGQNVEWVTPLGDSGRLALRVWERGAGITQACGTGSVAAAAAAAAWGLAGERAELRNPGGALEVDLSGGEAVLSGPAAFVARVEVDRRLSVLGTEGLP